jgi:hypothetical protein
VLLSDGAWRRFFGGDRSMVGRSVLLGGRRQQIVGVLPRSTVIKMSDNVDVIQLSPVLDLSPEPSSNIADSRRLK